VEDLLKKLDFEVFVETNRDLRRMRRALEDFKEDAAGADVALLFFAGHGVALDGVNYLLPTDADPSSARKAGRDLAAAVRGAGCAEVCGPVAIVLLDACRDDPFATGATGSEDGRSAAALDGADPPEPPKGRQFPAWAGSGGQMACFSPLPPPRTKRLRTEARRIHPLPRRWSAISARRGLNCGRR
jgi:hypothetical protein